MASMDLSHGEAIDSYCHPCRALGRKEEAVDWTTGTDGRRYYVCEEHAHQLGRYGRDLDDLPETPHAQPCARCTKMTLTTDLDPAKKACPECMGEEETAHAIMEANDGIGARRAVAILNELMTDEEAHVDPDEAAEAVERLTGVVMEPVDKHVCEECGRSFDSQQALSGHQNAHSPEETEEA